MFSRKQIIKFLNMDTGLFELQLQPNAPFFKETMKFIKRIEEADKSGNWKEFIEFFHRRIQIIIFLHIRHHFNDKEYYEILGGIINDGIYMHDYYQLIQYLLRPPGRDVKYMEYMMSEDERKIFAELQPSTIFRGCTAKNQAGYSWTLSLEHAKFFADRNCGDVYIMRGTFEKSDVIVYWERENEIFIEPDKVKNIAVERTYYNEEAVTNEYHQNVHMRVAKAVKQEKEYKKILGEEIRKVPVIRNSVYQ